MAKELILKRGDIIKTGYVGFSWTVFFFGFFPPLIRKDFLAGLLILVIQVVVGFLTVGIGGFIVQLIISFGYNKYYTMNLLKEGFKPMDDMGKALLTQYDIYY